MSGALSTVPSETMARLDLTTASHSCSQVGQQRQVTLMTSAALLTFMIGWIGYCRKWKIHAQKGKPQPGLRTADSMDPALD